MRRFFIQSSPETGTRVTVTGQDAKHIRSVLRLKPGDRIVLVDGNGNEYTAVIDSLEPHRILVGILERNLCKSESPLNMTAAVGFLKEKKMDLLVRQLCELGVTNFLPYFAERSVPKPSRDRIKERVRRWERIAQESIKQCRRGKVPQINAPVDFTQMLAKTENDAEKIVFWEKAVEPLPQRIEAFGPGDPKGVTVLLGPEGGLSESEIQQAEAAGFKIYSLGPRILRAETAVVAACALVQFLWGDMGKEGER